MKLFTQWRFILLAAFFSILGAGNVWAQLTELEKGKVYHFTNVGYDKAMGATVPNSVAGVNVDKNNYTQLWYVESTEVKNEVPCYTLRNLAFGTYLQGNGQSSKWTLATTTAAEASWISLSSAAGYNVIKAHNYGDYGFAHIDGSSNVVGWSTDASATQWTISKIEDMSDDAIQAALGIFNNVATYQTALNDLFSDKACTTLKSGFSESNPSFLALPTTLQNMVRKVAGTTSWEEANKDNTKESWGAEYAKKYRVQLYEPYNEPECAAKALRINAHTNLNNPTGIFANKDDILYVMVEGSIEPGATLYLSYYKGHDRLAGATDGYELKQGLNVIPVYYDESNFCVNYVVNTFDTSKGYGSQAKAHPLSDYDPIKIHIEGGYINGYWNKMGDALYTADTDEDWNYIEARATQQDVVVLGKYMTLKFPLLSVHAENHTAMSQIYNEKIKVSESINEWDNIMLWERFVMGLSTKADLDNSTLVSPYSDKKIFEYTGEDYTDYYNVHGLAYSIESSKNPHGGWDYTGYPNNSMVNINADIFTNAGAHWTAGHEIGHQHQGPLNMRGLTEVTNNLFSNVVLWCFGKSTSRYNGTDGSLTNVLQQFNAEGTDFFSNNIWAQTIMYYKLFLYYHVLGHNTQFYPRLYEMLRQNPMIIEGDQDGSKCLMHFYKLCCEAAGEDLTEFFRAHGFFEVMNSRFVGDYSNATYNLTQAQIDQAITEVRAKDYPVNLAVLFINDATGEEIQSHKGGVLELYGETRVCSEIGSYSNFNGDAANYTYGVAGNVVTMEGEGGVGFAILNEKGELIGFSDKKTFELSAEAAAAIASGKASIVTLNADNTPVAATNVMDTGNTEAKYELLGELLGSAKQLFDLSDETGTKVGYYRVSSLTNLQEAYESAKAVYDAQTIAAYSAVYDVLYQEYANLMNNDYARINITEGYAYRLTNKAYADRSMGVKTAEGDDKNEMLGLTTANENAQLWYFEAGASPATYYLKNKATGLYPGDVSTGAVLKADKSDKTTDNGAHAYRLQNMGNGVFALVGETGLHCSASQYYNIVGWGADAEATQWYITANELNDALEARTKLEELIGKTEALVNEIAEYTLVNKLELQTEDNSAANYLSTNACHNTLNNASDGQGLAGLLDESTGTFFHSDYHGTVKDPHYLQVDLGENHTVEQFKFNYTTRDNGNNCPISIKVEGSGDGSTFEVLNTFTAANDGLPNGNALSWKSPVISNEGNYRYLRFTVTEAEGPNVYFVMSTFGVSDVTPVVNEIKEGYANDDASKEALKTQIKATLYELADAHQLVDGDAAEASVYNEEIKDLDYYYQALLEVVNDKSNAALDAKKADLDDLITLANTLIKECGTVTFTPGTFDGRAKLQTTDENDRFYIWTNAQELDEGPIANLIDGDIETYFHSDYSGTNSTDGKDHHLTVNLGTGVTASSFQFSYTTRHDADANYPKTIKVYGSTDGKNFDDNEVAVITGLTAENSWTYNSDVITESKEFTHLRFMVTENNNNNIQGGHPIFHMAEFSLTINGRPENYAVTLNNNIGVVDEALLVAAYKEKEEAVYVKANAITETQIDEAIAELQAKYDALLEAKNTITYITDLSQLSNTAVYGLSTSRGPLAYISGTEGALSTPKQGSDADIPANPTENEGEQFAILRTENTPAGKYYLYNISKQRFVNTGAAFAENPVAVTSFSATSNNDYPWFVWLGGNERININKGNGLIMCTADYAGEDEGNQFRIEYVKTDAEATKTALEAIIALETAVAEAQAFLDNTPNTVGYPVAAERTTLQGAIDVATDIATIEAAVLAFKESGNINLPEDGKAYVFTNVHSVGGKKYLNYAESGLTMVPRGDGAANDLPESAKWYCRKLVDGRYTFVNTAGKYLVFKGSNNGTNSNKGYVDAYDATYSPITFVKMTTSPYTGSTKLEDLFGYVAFGGRRIYNGTSAYFVTEADGDFQQDTGWTLRYDDSYSTAFIVEEVTNYPFANTKLTKTSKENDTLLKGIEDGQTVSTFSAPYATVIPTGVTAYYAKKASQGETLYLTAVESGKALPACQGVILIGDNKEVTTGNFVPATTETLADLSNNVLKNTATGAVTAGDNDYALAKGDDGIGIYKVKEGTKIKAGKAYLTPVTPSQARSFVLSFSGAPTAIEDSLTDTADAERPVIYDLYGRRVNETIKGGIYIVNGKKVFIK